MKKILRIIYKTLILIKNYRKYCIAPYKDYTIKSTYQIFCDQLYIIVKNGYIEPFYFLYNFQKKDCTKSIMDRYLNYVPFQMKINNLNLENPHFIYNGRVITADKYYFYLFCKSIGIPVPNVVSYIRNNKCIYGINCLNKGDFEHIFDKRSKIFIKPCSGQLGQGSFTIEKKQDVIYLNGRTCEYEDFIQKIRHGDWIVQDYITQHSGLLNLNPSSVNTIRLQTVISEEGEIVPFGALLRIGRNGQFVDNWAKGGIAVGIDMGTGTLMKYGYLKPVFGTRPLTVHPNTQIPFEGYSIPFFFETVSLAKKLHSNLYRCHSVGWDIAITPEGPLFIEGNGLWEISLVQATHGGLKNEILKYFEPVNNKNKTP